MSGIVFIIGEPGNARGSRPEAASGLSVTAAPPVDNQSASGIVRAERLSKQVVSPEGPLLILDDINFTIAKGESVAVVGASGSGKSTLLGLLAGLDMPSQGRVWLAGSISAGWTGMAAPAAGATVGFVFQSFQLLTGLTALENVMLPLGWLANPTPAARRWNCWNGSACGLAPSTIPRNSPVANNSEWPSPALLRRQS